MLRIRADEDLPDYIRAASLDDVDRANQEAHRQDAFCSYRVLAEKRSHRSQSHQAAKRVHRFRGWGGLRPGSANHP